VCSRALTWSHLSACCPCLQYADFEHHKLDATRDIVYELQGTAAQAKWPPRLVFDKAAEKAAATSVTGKRRRVAKQVEVEDPLAWCTARMGKVARRDPISTDVCVLRSLDYVLQYGVARGEELLSKLLHDQIFSACQEDIEQPGRFIAVGLDSQGLTRYDGTNFLTTELGQLDIVNNTKARLRQGQAVEAIEGVQTALHNKGRVPMEVITVGSTAEYANRVRMCMLSPLLQLAVRVERYGDGRLRISGASSMAHLLHHFEFVQRAVQGDGFDEASMRCACALAAAVCLVSARKVFELHVVDAELQQAVRSPVFT